MSAFLAACSRWRETFPAFIARPSLATATIRCALLNRWVRTRSIRLREACRYVVLNPVRAGLCDHPSEWRWSSYRASAGFEEAPPYLALGELLSLFHTDLPTAVGLYRDYIDEGLSA